MLTEWPEEAEKKGDYVGRDPAIDWLLREGNSDFGRSADDLIPILVTLRDRDAVAAFRALRRKAQAARYLMVPRFVIAEEVHRPFGALVTPQFLAGLDDPMLLPEAMRPEVDAFAAADKVIRLSDPLAVQAPKELVEPPVAPRPDGTAPPVIVAVIDDAFAVGHARFRDADGNSRVHHLWIMDAPAAADVQPTVDVGREWCKATSAATGLGLDDLLNGAKVGGQIDDDRFLRAAGLVDPAALPIGAVSRRLSHGTHVLDLAAGYPPHENRVDRPIIAVQLPRLGVLDTSGASLDAQLALALDYIRERASRIAEAWGDDPIPVVVNISYGYTAGPHDGTTQIEVLMDHLIGSTAENMQITIAAGNAHLARGHARIPSTATSPQVEPGMEVTLSWRVLPDDRTPSLLQLWLPCRAVDDPPDRVRVTVKPPSGPWSPELSEDPTAIRRLRRTDVPVMIDVADLAYGIDPASGRGRFELRLLPTARDPSGDTLAVAPAGVWQVRLRALQTVTPDRPVEVWVQRSDSLPGHPQRGRQSHLEHPDHPTPTAREFALKQRLTLPRTGPIPGGVPVRRENMVNAIATGACPVVVGGHMADHDWVLPFSAGGPTAPPRQPDLLTQAAESLVLAGTLAAGSRSGVWVEMGGTSVAAPRTARRIADEYAANAPAPTRARMRSLANGENPTKPADPQDRVGAGRLTTHAPPGAPGRR
jgi:hypothetical protein